MRILFPTSPRRDLVKVWVCQESSPGGSLLPPVDLASLAAAARSRGHEVKIAELRTEAQPLDFYQEELHRFQPDLVVFNLSTTGATDDYELLRLTPAPTKRACFGTHAQAERAECLARGADFIFLGDPEAGLLELLQHQLNASAIAKGVVSAEELNAEPLYWEKLDTLPFPALDLLSLDHYHAPYIRRGRRFTLLLSGRGCPFKCTYCLYPVLFGSEGRRRSPKNVVDEMEHDLREFGIRDFYFLDATFNLSAKAVEEFCEVLLERNLKVEWSCNMRVSPVNPTMLALMKKAGCRWIFFGVEDQDFLRETKKGTSRSATEEAFRLAKAAGISTVAFTMVFPREGLPEKAYAEEVLSTLHRLEADAFQCNVAIPFPGTPIFEEYRAAYGTLARDWKLYDPHGRSLTYPGEHLIEARKQVYRSFLLRHPWKVVKVALQMSPQALFSQAVRFWKENVITTKAD